MRRTPDQIRAEIDTVYGAARLLHDRLLRGTVPGAVNEALCAAGLAHLGERIAGLYVELVAAESDPTARGA